MQSLSSIPHEIIEGLNTIKDLLALDSVFQRLTAFEQTMENTMLKDRVQTTLTYIQSLEATINDFMTQEDPDKVYFMAMRRACRSSGATLSSPADPFRD